MKFRIRYADQMVGILIIAALISLVFVIFMLGSTQRWFSKKHSYKTFAVSASGLSQNMDVTCRGYPIGKVKSFELTEDNRIMVIFTILNEFHDRARVGSLAEIIESPIGLGARFIFYPGLGEGLEEGALVPLHDSPEGKNYLSRGLAFIPPQDDAIAAVLEKVFSVLDDLKITMEGINVGPNERSATALGQTIANIQSITASLAAGDSIDSLDAVLASLAQTMDSIEKTAAILPRDMPALLIRVSTTLQSVEDILISLRNNPLLRRGIPEHAEIDSSGTNPRNIQF
ncbi:MAG: MlaD family protein [Treponema sp.]|jgi:phospholipid/cholesterol/gamma-HCH transport system substrate-binding protein|nr:MlaD family protein [Treponema sp.]